MTGVEPLLGLRAPADRARLRHGSATHVGRVRALNEDRCFTGPEMGIYAVADGMGGHEAGEVAATAVVDSLATIGTAVTPTDLLARLEDRVLRAHGTIRQIGQARGHVIGTTLAALLVFEPDFACIWAGDSRIYQIRGGRIAQLSRDHTEAQALVDSGAITPEEAKVWPRRNVITRAVGVRPEPEMELLSGVLEPGDVFVLCSDGLTAHAEAEDILARAADEDPQAACDALVALSLERGGSDNVTVVIVRFEPEDGETGPAARTEAAQTLQPRTDAPEDRS